jgi:hypothetical protein
MTKMTKLIFASVLALSGVTPAFAGHVTKMSELPGHSRALRSHPHDAMNARAYAPEGVPADVRAYAPNEVPIGIGPDFGIGSQR